MSFNRFRWPILVLAAWVAGSPLAATDRPVPDENENQSENQNENEPGEEAPETTGPVTETFEEIVVVTPRPVDPLTVETDPKAPRQPLPAHDGADFLKSIPGFSVARKGGADGDPVFRGMAGSRLGIVLDGEHLFGGCGSRMDPPTAYVYPEAYDRVTVLKGPQTVSHGPGQTAGTVLFERDTPRFETSSTEGHASLVGGSFGRNDQVFDAVVGRENLYARGVLTRSETGDYEDGAGRPVHSRYLRWSTHAAIGWTPDPYTVLEISGGVSDGEAAYADRAMDGSMFRRDNVGLRFERQGVSPRIEGLETRVYYNYVDHVMDDYSLRPSTGRKMVANPDRETTGGRFALTLDPGASLRLTLGVDQRRDVHSERISMDQDRMPYETLPRIEDAEFRVLGLFAEGSRSLGGRVTLVAGLRVDRWRADDLREAVRVGMTARPNPTAGDERERSLVSGFVRQEVVLDATSTLAVGLGHGQRFPDYWELLSRGQQSESTLSAFHTRPEETTQLDVGWVRRTPDRELAISAFASRVNDYVLIDHAFPGKPGVAVTRNVDAATWGGEASGAWKLGPWKIDGALAYVRGENRTDDTPLAQLSPLEGRIGLTWNRGAWSAGGLLRQVARQDRVDPGAGTIVGQDLGETPSFTVLSVNGSWRSAGGLRLSVGVDNLLDELYAEHVSRGGEAVAGYVQTTRVDEPGRTLWVRAATSF